MYSTHTKNNNTIKNKKRDKNFKNFSFDCVCCVCVCACVCVFVVLYAMPNFHVIFACFFFVFAHLSSVYVCVCKCVWIILFRVCFAVVKSQQPFAYSRSARPSFPNLKSELYISLSLSLFLSLSVFCDLQRAPI